MHPGELTYLTHMYVLTIKELHLSVIRHADGSSHFYVYIYIHIHIYPSHFDFVGVVSVVSRWEVQVGWA